MSDDRPIYGLACSGGGAHGAYQVGVLKYIHEHFCVGEASPFRVFSGTSAGSLNTSFCSARSYDAHTARLELEQNWRDFDVPEYYGNPLVNAFRMRVWSRLGKGRREDRGWSALNPAPVHAVVEKGFSREGLDRAIEAGTTLGVAIAATELRTGGLVWFTEGSAASDWARGFAVAFATRLRPEHVVASCSVPFVFPPVEIDGRHYSDGELSNRTPFIASMNMGATRILNIATDCERRLALPEPEAGFTPGFTDIVGMARNSMRYDYVAHGSQLLDIINYFCERMPEEEREETMRLLEGGSTRFQNYKPVELRSFAPTREIGKVGMIEADVRSTSLRNTRLQFRTEFVDRLIDEGYEDATERHDELAEFFDPDRPQRKSSLWGESHPDS